MIKCISEVQGSRDHRVRLLHSRAPDFAPCNSPSNPRRGPSSVPSQRLQVHYSRTFHALKLFCRTLHALLTEERGIRRGSPKGTTSGGVNLEAAAGRDSPKNLLGLCGVGVDDGGGGVVVIDDGGGSRPSAIMTRDASTRGGLLELVSLLVVAVVLSPIAASVAVAVTLLHDKIQQWSSG